MIAKTGANYQANGGYIEFAEGQDYSIINDRVIPGGVYSTTTDIISILPISVSVTNSTDTYSLLTFRKRTVQEQDSFFTYVFLPLTTTPQIAYAETNYGMRLTVVGEITPVLAEGSRDVKLIKDGSDYYVIITGPNPVLIVASED